MLSNIRRGLAATGCYATIVAAPLLGQVAAPPPPAAPAQPEGGIRILESQNTRPPDPMVAMKAYQALDAWVRGWTIGERGGLPSARAAAVTLRLDGEIIGRGLDVAVRPEGDAAVTALAAEAALREA